MSTITTFFEVPSDESGINRDGTRDPIRRFTVQTSVTAPPVQTSEEMLDLILRSRPDLKPFKSHPWTKKAYVTEPRVLRKSRWLWELTVPYSTEVDLEDLELKERGGDKNPVTKPAEITVTMQKVNVIITEDIQGRAIQNRAGDRYPDVEDVEYWLEFSISKNVAKIKKEWLLDYPNSVNQEEIKLLDIPFPAKHLLLTDFQVGKRDVIEDVKFFPINLRLTYRKKGWLKELLNVGRRERRAVVRRVSNTFSYVDSYRLEKIRDTQGVPVDEPVFLDAKGRAFRVGVDPEKELFEPSDYKQPLRTALEKEEILTLTFEVKEPLPFSRLPIK